MPVYYSLEVFRAQDVVWRSLLSNTFPNLYVKVQLGDLKVKTLIIKRSNLPAWNTTLPLSSFDALGDEDLVVELKHKSRLLATKRVGIRSIKLKYLLDKSVDGEVELELEPHSNSSSVTGVVVLRLCTDSQAENLPESALVGNSTVAAAASVMERVGDQINEQSDLIVSIGSLLESVGVFVNFIDKLATIHPYANAGWQVLTFAYKSVRSQIELDQEVIKLAQTMKDIFDDLKVLTHSESKARPPESIVEEIVRQFYECCIFIQKYIHSEFIERLFKSGAQEKIQEFQARFAKLKEMLFSRTAINSAIVSARMSEIVDLTFLRQELDPSILQKELNPSEMDASGRPRCLPGTRREYLAEIMTWILSDTETNILWLYGAAGSGKSTISATIADECSKISHLGAHLFFVRSRSNLSAVIRTIAFWLASFNNNIAERIRDAVRSNRGITMSSLGNQFEKLLYQPLMAAVDAMIGPVVIILDALDECGTHREPEHPEWKQREELLKLLGGRFSELPHNFRFIITSRPEEDIKEKLTPFVHMIELKVLSVESRNDVSTYTNDRIRAIFKERRLPTPLDTDIKLLSKTANGLFIWASTAMNFVSTHSDNPRESFEILLSHCRPTDADSTARFSDLDYLYDTVLRSSGLNWGNELTRARFSRIFGLILLSKVPLPVAVIDDMLGLPAESSRLILERLQSVCTYTYEKIDSPILLLHSSFSDYLMAPERREQLWVIDVPSQRILLAKRCFDIMEGGLRFNICNISSSYFHNDKVPRIDRLVKENIPPHLDYACRFWSKHLREVPYSSAPVELLNRLTTFAKSFLLYWLEVLSLTKCFHGVASRALYKASLWNKSDTNGLSSYLQDGSRFASTFATPIAESIPHIYLSALSLAKGEFTVADHYAEGYPDVQIDKIGIKPLQPCIKLFEEDVGIRSILFPPDGEYVALASADNTIRIHNAKSGEAVSGPFEGHSNGAQSITFSADGKRIAACSAGKVIRVWNVESGKPVSGPFSGHTDDINSLVFSPEGTLIASASNDGTVRIWNVENGGTISGPLKGHVDNVLSVAFSPNGTHVASGSADETIRIWDVQTSTIVSCLPGPSSGNIGSVHSLAFSPNGKYIASGSNRGDIITVWAVDSGELVAGPFQGHTARIYSVAFSPDGRRVMSASDDETVRIWDIGYCNTNSINAESDPGSSGFDIRAGDSIERSSSSILQDSDAEKATKFSLLSEWGLTSSWIMSEDGWLLGKKGELLLWLPPDMRETLWEPSNVAMFNCPFSTRVDFTGSKLGEGWSEGYPRAPRGS